MGRMAELHAEQAEYRQMQELEEFEQWLADPVAQAEYKIWLKAREAERVACEYPILKDKESENEWTNRK